MPEPLHEFVDSRGVALRVDRAAGVLRGVKLIGLQSLNGRRYRPAALSAAVALYEAAKVNVNHPPDGPLAPRDYRDRLGVIRQVEFRPDEGLFGNLHYNPKHPLAEQLAWDAEHNPRNVGFSHNVLARLSRDAGQTVVEAITHVQSVDLVADPAATQGLFEQQAVVRTTGAPATAPESPAPRDQVVQRAALEQLEQHEQLGRLQTSLAEALARAAVLARQLRIRTALDAHRVPLAGQSVAEALGAAFYEALLAAPDDAQVDALVAERAETLRVPRGSCAGPDARPRSRDLQAALDHLGDRVTTAAEFAQALRLRRV